MKDIQSQLSKLFNLTHANQKMSKEQLCKLYQDLITEEYCEFIVEKDPNNKFKEGLDLIWVITQYANAQGWDLEKGMNLLVQEYKSKFLDENGNIHPIYREDGKLLKNKGFKKLDLNELAKCKLHGE